jgi:N-acyl-D-amino-acid deacylase
MLDIVIKNGTIIDGKNSKRFIADIGIRKDKIYVIGKNLCGKREIDADGLVVCPGFIDMHSHSDANLLMDSSLDSKIQQGITTEVIGNCGYSIAPIVNESSLEVAKQLVPSYKISKNTFKKSFKETFNVLEKKGLLTNIIPLVGHGVLRAIAMGFEKREAKVSDINRMKKFLILSLKDGVFGMSTGLIYPPGFYSNVKELTELAKIISDFNGIYASHIRGESHTLFNAVNEIIQIGKNADVKVHISHIKCMGKFVWNKSNSIINMLEDTVSKGINITADMYPYVASSTLLFALFPLWVYEDNRMLERLKDRKTRRIIASEMEKNKALISGIRFKDIYISASSDNKIVGLNIEEIAKRLNTNGYDVIFDIVLNSPKTCMVFYSIKENDLINFLKYERICIGCDSRAYSAKGDLFESKPHPRGFGTFPRVISTYVREKRTLNLEEIIYKMTYLPSKILNLYDRGCIDEGKIADIVIFDLNKIKDTSTFKDPFSYPEGIEYVIINGKIALQKNKIKGLFGKILKRR